MFKLFGIFTIVVALMCAVPAFATEDVKAVPDSGNPGKIGFGFHTLSSTEDTYAGVSIRGWTDSWLGMEGNFYYSNAEVKNEQGVQADGDLALYGVKLMAAPVRAEQSKFYFFGEGLWGKIDDIAISDKADIATYGAGFGFEWNFAGVPELGIDIETGYYLTDTDGTIELENEDQEVKVGFGMHYYFD